MRDLRCRNCDALLTTTFVDLGVSPLSNSYVPWDRAGEMEPFYPLHARVCEVCFLVQVPAFELPERIFSHYAYFSSFSDSWLEHCRNYVNRAIERLALRPDAIVAEAASNDGYLLQYFVQRGFAAYGVEPAENVAAIAQSRGIPTEVAFLGARTGVRIREARGAAQLVAANNVIAHVPDLHDFIDGLEALMASGGTLTVEIPHLLALIDGIQFDTIYHEHFSYFSLLTMENVLARHDLRIWDVERLSTHGGSLRYWIVRGADPRVELPTVAQLRAEERACGLTRPDIYRTFADRVIRKKREVLAFFLRAGEEGKVVAGYGAPAKGNTLLNYCGIREDMMPFTVDRNPEKQHTLLPGTRIPVYGPDHLAEVKPNYVMILPWNIRDEVMAQNANVRSWGGRFVCAMPQLEIL
jgi:C-methyltransferase C-terminal domain/Putative zinc binding domain/Methyltransferase domain